MFCLSYAWGPDGCEMMNGAGSVTGTDVPVVPRPQVPGLCVRAGSAGTSCAGLSPAWGCSSWAREKPCLGWTWNWWAGVTACLLSRSASPQVTGRTGHQHWGCLFEEALNGEPRGGAEVTCHPFGGEIQAMFLLTETTGFNLSFQIEWGFSVKGITFCQCMYICRTLSRQP